MRLKQLIINWYQRRLDNYNSKLVREYIKNGRKPWSPGYGVFKLNLIREAIADPQILSKFHNSLPLPEKYGEFIDERIVEYPLLLSRIDQYQGNILDAGSTLNNELIVKHEALKNKKLTLLTLAPEENCFWHLGISYVFADIRELPFKNNLFDAVVSVSTLEHIGMDNTLLYSSDPIYKQDSKYDFIQAVKELKRVLKPGGKCLVTVPFGQYQHDEFQQQFNSDMVESIKDAFNPTSLIELYYKYADGGWNISTREKCKNCQYFNIHKTKYFDKNSSLDYDEDFAAAARAIVTLEMIK
ncbi:class I SAM-dependent methyltransferase [Roseofilum capinflatum]|uniref:Class I SAM-dependent methyltransferase n=1 Tax=Roseofilum capinflatum BLCC-M114 TaxID=3022440 RepID=A0ABT7B8A8_9CYAN|nr:class I SAM-dependent methyltransferase [Roseofilum capinflatum]MDJ1175410.1 class I SAM-dependent methyltransferase [Roseofilum capinflatum BLCC-M114]